MPAIYCCGREVRAKKGKPLACPSCGTQFAMKKSEKKRTFHKEPVKSNYTMKDTVYLLGLMLILGAVAAFGIGFKNLWDNGLRAFNMESLTLIVLMGLCGWLLMKSVNMKIGR